MGYAQIRKDPINGQAHIHFTVWFVARVMSQFTCDFHHTGQEIHSEGYYSNLNCGKRRPYNGPFTSLERAVSRSIQHTMGQKQNRKEPHIVCSLLLPSVAFALLSVPVPYVSLLLWWHTFNFTAHLLANGHAFHRHLGSNNSSLVV